MEKSEEIMSLVKDLKMAAWVEGWDSCLPPNEENEKKVEKSKKKTQRIEERIRALVSGSSPN